MIFVGKANSVSIVLTKRICGCSFQRSQWASFFDDGECCCSPSPGFLLSQTAYLISERAICQWVTPVVSIWRCGEPDTWHDINPCLSIVNWHAITLVHAIIFLAPLTFNLTLEEDPSVNRIEDSIMIWKAICSNKLLERTAIILFLNKMDVLAATLGSGLRVKDYVTSYGDLPNDVPSVSRCMSLSPCISQFTNFLV